MLRNITTTFPHITASSIHIAEPVNVFDSWLMRHGSWCVDFDIVHGSLCGLSPFCAIGDGGTHTYYVGWQSLILGVRNG